MLHFSDSLGTFYVYNRGQDAGQTGYTKFFHLPKGVDKVTVEVARWAKKGKSRGSKEWTCRFRLLGRR